MRFLYDDNWRPWSRKWLHKTTWDDAVCIDRRRVWLRCWRIVVM